MSPLSQPRAYQEHLIGLLGEHDPAEVQSGTVAPWKRLLEKAGEDGVTRPAPAEWSVLECLAHEVDAEFVMSARYRWIVAQDEPPLIGYDQDLWVDRLHRGVEDPVALIGTLAALKRANVAMWEASTAEERARVGMHAERGPESYELSYRMIAGHDRFHLAQARRALDIVRAG